MFTGTVKEIVVYDYCHSEAERLAETESLRRRWMPTVFERLTDWLRKFFHIR